VNQIPYIFTQQHRDALWWWNGTWLPQTVPAGARVQVQLPSDPIRWIPRRPSECTPTGAAALLPRARVELVDHTVLPDPGRISGSAGIDVFDYQVHGLGALAICLDPDPVPDQPGALGLPPGSPLNYTLTLLVGIPQLSLLRPRRQATRQGEALSSF
jgi:hypothetical protein